MQETKGVQEMTYEPRHAYDPKHMIGEGVPFQRIRRITGYLTGDINRWNDAKKAELNDRCKHMKTR